MKGRLAAETERKDKYGDMGTTTPGIRIGFRFGQRCIVSALQVKDQVLQAIH